MLSGRANIFSPLPLHYNCKLEITNQNLAMGKLPSNTPILSESPHPKRNPPHPSPIEDESSQSSNPGNKQKLEIIELEIKPIKFQNHYNIFLPKQFPSKRQKVADKVAHGIDL